VSAEHQLSSVEEVLADARRGKMIILVDDEERENEGDLVIPADHVTPEAINFMAMYGRGLICLALTGARVGELGLSMMARENLSRHNTAFTVSIEAREGVTTGISAADRAHTVSVAIDPAKGRDDIATPGHVFPVQAREGGVLIRAGHTEAAVDIARLAGLNPAGVMCEIMKDDGSMARAPDLFAFAQRHRIKIATIADLIAYRRRNDTIVKRVLETEIDSAHGGKFRMITYVNTVEPAEHIALVKGDLSGPEPVLVRVHVFNIVEDVLGSEAIGGGLHVAMARIAAAGRGVAVVIRETEIDSVSKRARAQRDHAVPHPVELRDIGTGAQILRDLGVSDMTVLSNSQRPLIGLDGYGLRVVSQEELSSETEPDG
jgi:3,4-dihydroxy 2-butanone 4-phosphate synthase/GTP cyclohydrolase II